MVSKKCCVDLLWCAWVLLVEVGYGIWSEDIVSGHPHVFPCIIALPFDLVFQAAVVELAVEDFFDFVLFLSINQGQGWGVSSLSTWDKIWGCRCQFCDREYGP
jgi:hypothetical protein